MNLINKVLSWFLKKRYKVVQASEVKQRDVTAGFEKRNINKKKTAIIGRKKMQYTQDLLLKRGIEYLPVHVFVNFRLRKKKGIGTQLILKPKKVGDTIRI